MVFFQLLKNMVYLLCWFKQGFITDYWTFLFRGLKQMEVMIWVAS